MLSPLPCFHLLLLLCLAFLLFPEPVSTFVFARPRPCSSTTKLRASQDDDAPSSHPRHHRHPTRRSVVTRTVSSILAATTVPTTRAVAIAAVIAEEDVDGIPLITRSDLGTTIRRTTVKSAQIADSVDERWERFSDSLRDKKRCDPNTNRRLFDNGFRRDGTRVGDPVLGALCDPVPLKPFDDEVSGLVLGSAEDQAVSMLGGSADKRELLRGKVKAVDELVGPSFARAEKNAGGDAEEREQASKRQAYSRSLYVQMRAYGEALLQGAGGGTKSRGGGGAAADYELGWGRRLLFDGATPLVAPGLANRKSFTSPFPALTEEDKGDLEYEEGALLDALGTVSAALTNLQGGGIVGHWELSIPTDDYGEVVTVAVDDDISLGTQALLKEQRRFNGSVVTAIVRAALDKVGITCSVDAFFLDPSTTKQDVYEPSQLLLNLSNIRRK